MTTSQKLDLDIDKNDKEAKRAQEQRLNELIGQGKTC